MSFLFKRGRIWWYYWRDADGRQQGKSLETPSKIVAGIKKGDEDRRHHMGEIGLPDPAAKWTGFKREFLAGYKDGSSIKELHQRTIQLFEECVAPSKLAPINYSTAKGFRDWLQKYVSPTTGRPLKPASINIHIRNIHTMFSEAKRLGYVAQNPFTEVRQIPDTKRAPRYLTKEQVKALLKEARRSWPAERVVMLLVLLYTGIRRGELANLKWSAVDLEGERVYLRGSETWAPKDREEHAIGLHPELATALRRHPRTSEYLFPGKNGSRSVFSLDRLFNRLYRRAGIQERGLHILRHTFATHFPGAEKTLQRVLGHSSLVTTQRYRHVTPEDLAAVKNISYR